MSSDLRRPVGVDLLVGRDEELRLLSEALLPPTGSPRPVVITGPGGIGKTALVAWFAKQHAERFPGGYVRLSARESQADDRALLAALAARLGLSPSREDKDEPVRKRLLDPPVLLHIEDVDTRAMALAVTALVRRLRGCAAVVAGRFEALGAGLDWSAIRLGPLGPEASMELLAMGQGSAGDADEDAARRTLVTALRGVPLALRLCARLVRAGKTPASVLAALEERRGPSDEPPPSSGRRLRNILEIQLEQALAQLEATLGDRAEELLAGWRFFAHAPPFGVGKRLGAALAGLTEADFERLMEHAEALALVEAETTGGEKISPKWRLHPLLAEVVRREEQKDAALGRVTAWFVERLSDPKDGWAAVREEMEGLAWWLGVVPEGDWPAVVRAGSSFATGNGPFVVWMNFCERALAETVDEPQRLALLSLLASVAQHGGDLERASVAAEETRELAVRTGSEHDGAVAWSILADVHAAQGHTGEAARIFQQEVLPVLERERRTEEKMVVFMRLADLLDHDDDLDSVFQIRQQLAEYFARTGQKKERAIALIGMGGIARKQWRLDEALRMQEEAVALLQDSGDTRTRAAASMELADTLDLKGEKLQALEIYKSSVLPVFRASGHRRGVALVLSRIASVLQNLGKWDEALKISRGEVMPVLEELGDAPAIANEKLRIGNILRATGDLFGAMHSYTEALELFGAQQDGRGMASAGTLLATVLDISGQDPERTIEMLNSVIATHKRRDDKHALAVALSHLAEFFEAREDREEALRLYQEEVLPILQNTDDQKGLVVLQGKIAGLLIVMGEAERALEILREQVRPYFERTQDEHGLAWTNSQIADALVTQGNTTESLRIYEADVRPIVERVGTLGEQAAVLAKMGTLQGEGGIDTVRRSVELIEQTGDVRQQMAIREILGRMLRRRNRAGDDEEALGWFDKAVADAHVIRSPREPALHRFMRNPTLERITIRNLKNIADLTVDFGRSSELPGHWTCIAGINGAGKSAILQAIALVLLGGERAADVGSASLERIRRRADDKIYDAEIRATVRMGRKRHELALHLGERGIHRERLEQDPAYPEMREIWLEREKDHILLSYGPGRNLSEHIDSRHNDKAEEVRRQMTLFDPLTQVASVEALLEAREETKIIWVLLRRLLTRVLEGTALTLDPDRSSLRFRMDKAAVSPVDLPDGFRATIALLADLCATWQKKAPDEARSGDPSHIRGIVLVDEIDLHLHPGLQRSLVPRLRRALPEVQWIVTTHSPLILGSFDKNEIVALEADPEHGVRLHPKLDRQILGFTTDEIYRWLMDVKPRSAELETHFGSGPEAHAKKTLILAQSPTVNEEEARANRDYRRSLAERKRRA